MPRIRLEKSKVRKSRNYIREIYVLELHKHSNTTDKEFGTYRDFKNVYKTEMLDLFQFQITISPYYDKFYCYLCNDEAKEYKCWIIQLFNFCYIQKIAGKFM